MEGFLDSGILGVGASTGGVIFASCNALVIEHHVREISRARIPILTYHCLLRSENKPWLLSKTATYWDKIN